VHWQRGPQFLAAWMVGESPEPSAFTVIIPAVHDFVKMMQNITKMRFSLPFSLFLKPIILNPLKSAAF